MEIRKKILAKERWKIYAHVLGKFPETPSLGLPAYLLMSKALVAWKPRLEAF